MPPKKRTKLTVQQKVEIIRELEGNSSLRQTDLANRYNMPLMTVNTIVRNKKHILEQSEKLGKMSGKRSKFRKAKHEELENILMKWINQARAAGINIDGSVVREKANTLAAKMNVKDFVASSGWFTRFKERNSLSYCVAAGESGAVDVATVETWTTEQLPKILEKYDLKDVFNTDETGVFFNLMPNRTIAVKGEKCHGGKMSKERITVLVTTNADGSEKIPILVIGKYKKPRCFKNVRTLPCEYKNNTKAWMTGDFFVQFLRALDAKMGTRNRKVALFLDCCPAHPQEVEGLRNVDLYFFPPNCTSKLQPLDLGVIKSLKYNYRRLLVQRALALMERNQLDQLKPDLLQAMHFLVASWNKVTPACIKNCFQKAGFESAGNHTQPSELEAAGAAVILYQNEEEEMEQAEIPGDAEEVIDTPSWELIAGSGLDFETYATMDDEVITSEVLSVEEIYENEQEEECIVEEPNSDSESSNSVSETIVPKYSDVLDSFQKVKTFISAFDVGEHIINQVANVESVLYGLRTKAVQKQTRIEDFFCPKK
ncbi:tigger transposable element-derived protein 4-like [Leptodactylus fuscus]